VNHLVAAKARGSGALVNVADDPDYCDFILPATLKRGPLTIAVSTGGISPALSRRIREGLEEQIGEEYEHVLEILRRLRRKLLTDQYLNSNERGAKLLEFTGYDLAGMVRDKNTGHIQQILISLFGYTFADLGLEEFN